MVTSPISLASPPEHPCILHEVLAFCAQLFGNPRLTADGMVPQKQASSFQFHRLHSMPDIEVNSQVLVCGLVIS